MADDLLGIGKVASAISQPLQDFLGKILGPAASEAGEILADRVKYARWKNSLNLIEQAQKEIEKRGIDPQKIPLKTLVPILEGASLESDDENWQTKWSNLLISAASGHSTHPSYPKILSEIAQLEAKILDYLYELESEIKLLKGRERSEENRQKIISVNKGFALIEIRKISDDKRELEESIYNLLRLKLCEYPEEVSEIEVITQASLSKLGNREEDNEEYDLDIDNDYISSRVVDESRIRLTILGNNFMKACQK